MFFGKKGASPASLLSENGTRHGSRTRKTLILSQMRMPFRQPGTGGHSINVQRICDEINPPAEKPPFVRPRSATRVVVVVGPVRPVRQVRQVRPGKRVQKSTRGAKPVCKLRGRRPGGYLAACFSRSSNSFMYSSSSARSCFLRATSSGGRPSGILTGPGGTQGGSAMLLPVEPPSSAI